MGSAMKIDGNPASIIVDRKSPMLASAPGTFHRLMVKPLKTLEYYVNIEGHDHEAEPTGDTKPAPIQAQSAATELAGQGHLPTDLVDKLTAPATQPPPPSPIQRESLAVDLGKGLRLMPLRAFGFDELGVFGSPGRPGDLPRPVSLSSGDSELASGQRGRAPAIEQGAHQGLAVQSGLGLDPAGGGFDLLVKIGVVQQAAQVAGSTDDGERTAGQTLPVFHEEVGKADVEIDSRGGVRRVSRLPLQAFSPTPRSAVASLTISGDNRALQVVIGSAGLDPEAKSRLRRMAANLVADHGAGLAELLLNGERLGGPTNSIMGGHYGARAG